MGRLSTPRLKHAVRAKNIEIIDICSGRSEDVARSELDFHVVTSPFHPWP